MSLIEATKAKYLAPTTTPITEPPKTKPEKKSVNLDFRPEGPAVSHAHLFSGPALDGPGVAGKVFGPKFPDPRKMTDAELASGIEKLGTAVRKNVGTANDADLKLHDALVAEAAAREALLLGSTKAVGEMSNRELFGHLLAFDAATAGGKPLTPAQTKRYGEITGAMKERATRDLDGEIKHLSDLRAAAKAKMALHCAAAAAGAFGLVTHVDTPAILASAAVIYVKVQQGHNGEAMIEGALLVAGRIPVAHKTAEAISTGLNLAECIEAKHEYVHFGKEGELLTAEKARLEAQKAKAK